MPPKAPKDSRPLTLRLTLIAPPAGVAWAVQLGRTDLMPAKTVTRDRIIFEIQLDLEAASDGKLRLRGAAVQGPSGGRFLYVNSGSRAGASNSSWNRRAKVSLESIPLAQLHAKPVKDALLLEAEIAGTAKDGGPACASVPLLKNGWTIA
jgi:hypothetical protein